MRTLILSLLLISNCYADTIDDLVDKTVKEIQTRRPNLIRVDLPDGSVILRCPQHQEQREARGC